MRWLSVALVLLAALALVHASSVAATADSAVPATAPATASAPATVPATGAASATGTAAEATQSQSQSQSHARVQPVHDATEQEAAANSSLLWGTYRPQVYFGMRPRLPKSLITGLLWSGLTDYKQAIQRVRHECSDQDGMAGYRWLYHDGRTFGVQTIDDTENNVRIETSFLKTGHHDGRDGKVDGGNWAVRIKGSILDPAKDFPQISPVYYMALESMEGSELTLDNKEDNFGIPITEHVTLSGHTPDLGEFTIRIEEPENARKRGFNLPVAGGHHGDDFEVYHQRTSYLGARVPDKDIWRSKDIIFTALNPRLKYFVDTYSEEDMPSPAFALLLPNDVMSNSNFFAFQKVFVGDFSFDVFFESKDTPRGSRLDTKSFGIALDAAKKAFDARFEHQFGLATRKGYLNSFVSFAREVTSSLLGGIGYWHGAGVVDRSFSHAYDADGEDGDDPSEFDEDKGVPNPQFTEETSLMSATPSRSLFPRGFYWDEGFHLAHIGVWDNDLSLEILKSWVNLIDEDGWVGREQGLGDEARSRIPERFQAQNPRYGNPPTFTAALAMYVDRLVGVAGKEGESLDNFPNDLIMSGSSGAQALFSAAHVGPNATFDHSDEGLRTAHLRSGALARSYLREIYRPLRRHYDWFRRTQRGELKRWGRKTASRSNEAYRWRGRTASHVLTSGLDDYPRAKVPHSGELHVDLHSWMGFFAQMMRRIAEVLGEEEDVREFESHRAGIVSNLDELYWDEKEKMYCDVSVDEDEESFHVCHRGYVSLFPLLLRLLPADSPKVGAVLDLLSDPEHLWSNFGIRSLSLKDEYFGKDENYWRGPIWIQMQYLALGALKTKYMVEDGPHKDRAKTIYRRLRKNVVENVQKEYVRTGYTWEQYDPVSGEGRRGHPFTGWTSTVALMMAEIY
ncbi:Processing alpha glucosidase I [Tilletia horrida]|nr:Processing alpha glucosidase I [Tilletia horrida]